MDKKILTVTLNPAIDYTIEVPNFTVDSVNRAQSGRRDPGGKGINVATALSQGGLVAGVTGFLGSDNSSIFQEHFGKNKISDMFIYVEGLTREGIKIADSKNVITTDINFPGFKLTEDEIQSFIEYFSSIVLEYDYVVLSGSLPVGVPKNIYSILGKIAKESGAYVALDTSGDVLKESIDSGYMDLIKPNINELSDIYPELNGFIDIEKALNDLCSRLLSKVGSIALSLGEEGSRLYSEGKVYNASTPKNKVKSTVGAGDTFLAGYIGGLAKGLNVVDSLINAGSWAASKLTMYGPGLSDDNPPESYNKEIIIT